jgi:hypothetical protein
MPVISALRQEDCKFEANQDYIETLSKKKKSLHKKKHVNLLHWDADYTN